ncbi:MAG: GNAT family N-acetyltransferase [Lachnospiraceae bacterium]|nr:GNAT family N-acetyltransferase [Lachnospiraceae bacterium]
MTSTENLSADRVDKYKSDIIQLIKETMIYNFPDSIIPEEYYSETIDSLLVHMKNGNAVVFAVFENDVLLGWMWCHPIDRFGSKRIHIASFAVKDDARKKGVGHKLIDAVEEYSSQQGYDGIDLLVTRENITAVKFYEKHGFEVERYMMRKVEKKNDF